MKQGISMYFPLVLLATVANYLSGILGSTFSEVVLVVVILVLIGGAVATKRGLEPYSTAMCGLAILTSMLAGLAPVDNIVPTILLIPTIIPSLMVVMESGERGSILYRMAHRKGIYESPEDVVRGQSRTEFVDDEVKFLVGMYDEEKPASLQEAATLAKKYHYTERELITHAWQQFKLPTGKPQAKPRASARRPQSSMSGFSQGPAPRRSAQSTIDGAGFMPRKTGGF